MMRRRDFITLLGGAAAAWPLAAHAQQRSPTPTIGWLDKASGAIESAPSTAFSQGLAQTGYVVGRNVKLEYRNAEGDADRMPVLAADLVRRQVAIIVTTSGGGVRAAKAATQSIPIVFSMGGDPLEEGIVASLNRPGGNATGVALLAIEIAAKRLELLHELVPKAKSIAAVVRPSEGPAASDFERAQTKGFQSAALALGVRLLPVNVVTEGDIAGALENAVQQHVGALLVGANRPFNNLQAQLISAANQHSLPTMFFWRSAVAGGGLASYGTDVLEALRQVGVYAGRILKGEKPADLPVQQPTKFDLAINLKTAKALGLTVPPSLFVRADELIE